MVKTSLNFALDDSEKQEQLKTEKQRKIVERIINELFQEDSSLYYAVTNDIARHVQLKIESKVNLNHNELEIVSDLTSQEIVNLISYNSKCC